MHRLATFKGLLPPIDRQAYHEGLRAMAPLGVAISVWGLVTGVAMVNSGLSIPMAILITLTVFAGSAQLAVLPLLATSAPLPIVWVTALLVNLRFVIFAAASRKSFVMLPWQQRMLAGYLNGDLGFALFSRRFADDPQRGTPEQWGYFYGGALVIAVVLSKIVRARSEKKRLIVGWSTEKPPISQFLMLSPISGSAPKRLVMTVAPQKDI